MGVCDFGQATQAFLKNGLDAVMNKWSIRLQYNHLSAGNLTSLPGRIMGLRVGCIGHPPIQSGDRPGYQQLSETLCRSC